MNHDVFGGRKMGLVTTLFWLSALIAGWIALLGAVVQAAEHQSTVRGLIYISQTGKIEGELVIFAVEKEVILLRVSEEFDRELDALRKSRADAIAKQRDVVYQAQQVYYNTLNKFDRTREERERSTSRLRQERAELTKLEVEYERRVQEILNKYAFAKTKTDSKGNFEFAGIQSDHYLIYAHLEIAGMGIHHYWLLPVKVDKGGTVEVTLNNLNTTPLYKAK
ncbi:MAG: hypothetical protein ACE5JU_18405 [Candidatus Binatia bacterium]